MNDHQYQRWWSSLDQANLDLGREAQEDATELLRLQVSTKIHHIVFTTDMW